MILSDLLNPEPDFDINCNIEVWLGDHNEKNSTMVYNSNLPEKPLSSILDLTINYITIINNTMIIEVRK